MQVRVAAAGIALAAAAVVSAASPASAQRIASEPIGGPAPGAVMTADRPASAVSISGEVASVRLAGVTAAGSVAARGAASVPVSSAAGGGSAVGVAGTGLVQGQALAAAHYYPCGFSHRGTYTYYRHCGRTAIRINVESWWGLVNREICVWPGVTQLTNHWALTGISNITYAYYTRLC